MMTHFYNPRLYTLSRLSIITYPIHLPSNPHHPPCRRYNLNIIRTEEHELTLSSVSVNDGQWHVVRVTRHGSAAILRMDGGEGRRSVGEG